MARFYDVSCTLLFAISSLGVSQTPSNLPDICSDRIDTANAWLALAGMTPNISDSVTVCQEASKLASPSGDANLPWAQACKKPIDRVPQPDPRVDLANPSVLERIMRVPQFKAEFLRTPNYVYGIPEGSPAGTTAQIFPNPDHGLLSLGGSLDLGEYFPDAGKLMTACEARLSLMGEGKANSLPGPCDDGLYLNAVRKGDWLRRYASATVINVNVNEVPRYESGVILSTASSHAVKWSYSVTGSISPSALFETAAQRKQYGDYYTKHHGELKDLDPIGSIKVEDNCMNDGEPDKMLTPECLKALSTSSIGNRFLLAILPKIDVKAYTAFDLTKTGSDVFFSLPEANKTIYDVTLTWDLKGTVPSIQMRSDAISAFQSMKEKKKADALKGKTDQAKITLGHDFVTLSESLTAGAPRCANDDWWSNFRDHFTTYVASKPASK